MKLSELVEKYRHENGISQRQLAKQCDLSSGYISLIEKEINPQTGKPMIPSLAVLNKLASGMAMSIDQLLSDCDDMPVDLRPSPIIDITSIPGISTVKTKKFRMLGNIACGEPIFTDQGVDCYVEAGDDINADFCLRAKGDSMIGARIFDGDTVFVRSQPEVQNGEIAVVLIDNEATLKRVQYDKEYNELTLYPENPAYRPMRFSGAELENVRILGKAVSVKFDLR